jgi:hypothetical protein
MQHRSPCRYMHDFSDDEGVVYKCAEQYMMAHKVYCLNNLLEGPSKAFACSNLVQRVMHALHAPAAAQCLLMHQHLQAPLGCAGILLPKQCH